MFVTFVLSDLARPGYGTEEEAENNQLCRWARGFLLVHDRVRGQAFLGEGVD